MSEANQIPVDAEVNLRKVVVATYYPPVSTFVIPKGIDLENEEQVSNWFVKYDILYIDLVDGKTIRVRAYISGPECSANSDYKSPKEEEISDLAQEDLDLDGYKEREIEYDSD